jgi:uncharacterized membrane protein YkgB
MIGQNEQREPHFLEQQHTERRQTNQDPQHRKLHTRRHNQLLLYMTGVWEIVFKIVIFRAVRTTNMANIGSYFLSLA